MDQLKRLRAQKGLSQARLAARAGVDPSTVNQIERGAREASPATLRKLADALDVSLAELLEEAGTPKVGGRSSLEPSFNDVLEEGRRPLRPWVRYVTRRIDWYEDLFRRRPGEFSAPLSSLDTAIQFAVNLGSDLARIKDVVRELTTLDPDAEEVRELVEVSDRLARLEERVAATVSQMVRPDRGEDKNLEEEFMRNREKMREWTRNISA